MFGLESGKQKGLMEFDLEKELKADPAKAKKMLSEIEKKISQIKETLRTGCEKSEMEALGTLLHGYTALLTVLNRIK